MAGAGSVGTVSDPTTRQALDEFPARYALTARFSLGTPRNLRVTAGGSLVVFCRARDPQNATLCLWALDVASGTERLLVDPAELGSDDSNLPPAERARRERARESASGIVDYSLDRAGTRACFALGGSLFVADLATGAVRSPGSTGRAPRWPMSTGPTSGWWTSPPSPRPTGCCVPTRTRP